MNTFLLNESLCFSKYLDWIASLAVFPNYVPINDLNFFTWRVSFLKKHNEMHLVTIHLKNLSFCIVKLAWKLARLNFLNTANYLRLKWVAVTSGSISLAPHRCGQETAETTVDILLYWIFCKDSMYAIYNTSPYKIPGKCWSLLSKTAVITSVLSSFSECG